MFNKTTDASAQSEAQELNQAPADEQQAEETAGGESREEAAAGAEQEWQRKYQELQDQFTRLAADFDNFRKRVREEQQAMAKYGAEKSVLELLPVLDNLDRATASLNENSDPKVLYQSFNLMSRQLMGGLESIGVKRIQAIGQPFDPQQHEAVSRMESADVPENAVLHEAQAGYMLHDKVIRPAQVVVSMGAPDGAAASEPVGENKPQNPFQNPG